MKEIVTSMTDLEGNGNRKGNLTDESLFRKIYDEYRRPLDHYLKTYCRNSTEREEIVQEVFIKIFRGLSTYDPAKPLKPYIYRIAGNTGIDWMRNRQVKECRTEDDFTETSDEKAPGPEMRLIRDEDRGQVRNLIDKLKPADRRLIHLYYYEDMKIREIAEIVERPAGTVKYRLHSIRKKLALKLKSLEKEVM